MAESKEGEQAFNVLNHELVPIHEVLDPTEAETLLNGLDISSEQLPKIMFNDPAARAAGAQPGQILRIKRKSRTAGEAVAYRLVIEYQV